MKYTMIYRSTVINKDDPDNPFMHMRTQVPEYSDYRDEQITMSGDLDNHDLLTMAKIFEKRQQEQGLKWLSYDLIAIDKDRRPFSPYHVRFDVKTGKETDLMRVGKGDAVFNDIASHGAFCVHQIAACNEGIITHISEGIRRLTEEVGTKKEQEAYKKELKDYAYQYGKGDYGIMYDRSAGERPFEGHEAGLYESTYGRVYIRRDNPYVVVMCLQEEK